MLISARLSPNVQHCCRRGCAISQPPSFCKKILLLNLHSYGNLLNYPVFFTGTIRNWKNLLKPEKYKVIVLNNLQRLVKEDEIYLFAYCIMSNHIHLIWQVRNNYFSSEIQKRFLERTSKQIKNDLNENHPDVLRIFASNNVIELIIFGNVVLYL
ncbi:MAG: transposase [Cytophagaceae bacterium]